MHVTRLTLQLKSLLVLCICITRYLLGHRLLCVVYLCELHHAGPGCCCTRAMLEWHHGYVMWGYIMATLWVCYRCCISQERGCAMTVLWLHSSQERINVSAVPMAPWVFLRLLFSCLAYPGFSAHRHREIQWDSWHCEQDQQDNWHHEQDLIRSLFTFIEFHPHVLITTPSPMSKYHPIEDSTHESRVISGLPQVIRH